MSTPLEPSPEQIAQARGVVKESLTTEAPPDGHLRDATKMAQPPVEGEVGELVAWLLGLADKRTCNRRKGIRPHPSALTRVAVLLQQQAAELQARAAVKDSLTAEAPANQRFPGATKMVPPPAEPMEALTSEEERLLEIARAAQVAGTFPSDSAIRRLTDGYGAGAYERRQCMAAARLALAYWGHAWGCLATSHPTPAEPTARPVLPPAEGEVASLAGLSPDVPERLRHCPTHGQQPANAWGCPECVSELRQRAALLERQAAPVPVPVRKSWSDRGWPEFSDCDAQGRLWCSMGGATWELRLIHSMDTHWLPAHALPLPSGEATNG